MTSLTERAYAKLNLCLTVGGVLPNGYHALESVMQSISLYDTVKIKKAESIVLSSDAKFLPTDSRNLAYKAAELFFKESGINGGAVIELTKRIPVCAGLGGGSSDGAATLRGLNRLYGTPFTVDELAKLSAPLGADVPFCVKGGTVFATGVGDVLEVLPHAPLYYVLLFDKTPLSTPKMYALLDGGGASFSDSRACREAILEADMEKAAHLAANSFYAVAKDVCPAVETNAALLIQNGALAATVTGKGPTVFGVFTNEKTAASAAKATGGILCKSVSLGE